MGFGTDYEIESKLAGLISLSPPLCLSPSVSLCLSLCLSLSLSVSLSLCLSLSVSLSLSLSLSYTFWGRPLSFKKS